MTTHTPRTVTSVLAEVGTDSVTITWGLGEPVDVGDVEFFGYGIYYYDPTGNGGKRLGVRFGDAITAWVFDNASATQARACLTIVLTMRAQHSGPQRPCR